MSIGCLLGGIQILRLTSADTPGLFLTIQKENITIWDVSKIDDLTWEFSVCRRDAKIIQRLANKRGDTCVILLQKGLYFPILHLCKRPVLILGLFCIIMLSWWLSGRILLIQVEGNSKVADRLIIEKVSECGIYFGASRRNVHSQQVKNSLLAKIPQLQWAGIRTVGCVAVISVQERAEDPVEEEKYGVSSIVASRDAVIESITVLRGNGLCKPGHVVKTGQVLISGYTDCGICIQATDAKGEIWAHTKRNVTAIFPISHEVKTTITANRKNLSIIIGKKQINFWKYSGISGRSCDKMYSQKYISLPGGFTLPISILIEEWVFCDASSSSGSNDENLLKDFAQQYVLQQMTAGKIESAQEFITTADDYLRLDGVYGCLENIGIVRVEENINNYGKDN